ncbi:MAG: hypothetical protein ACI80N_002001, partial [Gammaproteobacteria bacterium]
APPTPPPPPPPPPPPRPPPPATGGDFVPRKLRGGETYSSSPCMIFAARLAGMSLYSASSIE